MKAIVLRPTVTMPRSGLTLAELVMVLVILLAMAAMLVPLVGNLEITTPNGDKSPEQIATEHSLKQIARGIVGDGQDPGLWSDIGQRPNLFPRAVTELYLETHPTIGEFDKTTGLGWRGPYLLSASGRTVTGSPTVVDAWGVPIDVQVDFSGDGMVEEDEVRSARLVSAGADRVFQTPSDAANRVPGSDQATTLTLAECGDDIVLFLLTTDFRQ